jgi:3-oxoacyl-[acyl-carrier protein] reductase
VTKEKVVGVLCVFVRHVQDKMAVYAASKAGVIGFTKSVALELSSRNIRCNAIAPGFIETEMTAKLNDDVVQGWRDGIPLKRGGTTEDALYLFLRIRYERLRNRTIMNVDGGMHLITQFRSSS